MIYGTPEFDETLKKIIRPAGRDQEGYRYPGHHEAVKYAQQMSWHVYGETPNELLERVRPNEPPEVTNYRKENFEAITKSSCDKALHIFSKVFNPNLSSIRWKKENEKTKELKDYALEDYPDFNSVVTYMKEVLLREMIADPNGVIAIKLAEIPETDTEQVKPVIKLYDSCHVMNFDFDHYLIKISTEGEEHHNDSRVPFKVSPSAWWFFEYYDRNQFIYFQAKLDTNDELKIQEIERYPYVMEYVPVWPLGGKVESLGDGNLLYKSFIDAAVPYWNYAITHQSDLTATLVGHIFPQKYEITEPCNYTMTWEGMTGSCKGGMIRFGNAQGDGHSQECPKCDGTGKRSMIGPLGVHQINRDKLTDAENGPLPGLPIGYINVPIDGAQMLTEHVDKMLNKGMWAINMDVEDKVGEVQSGVAKTIDRSAQYDTLYNVGSRIFDVHLPNFFYFCNQLMFRNATDEDLPEINKPTQFDIYTAADLINNYKVAKDSGLDPNFLQIKQEEILTRDLTTNPDLKHFAFLMLDLDPLPGLDSMTISTNVSKGFNAQEDAVVHYNIKRFIERAFMEDKTFAQKPKKDQIEVLNKYAQEMIAKNKPQVDQTMLYENRTQAA